MCQVSEPRKIGTRLTRASVSQHTLRLFGRSGRRSSYTKGSRLREFLDGRELSFLSATQYTDGFHWLRPSLGFQFGGLDFCCANRPIFNQRIICNRKFVVQGKSIPVGCRDEGMCFKLGPSTIGSKVIDFEIVETGAENTELSLVKIQKQLGEGRHDEELQPTGWVTGKPQKE